jgi:hypothetical protein
MAKKPSESLPSLGIQNEISEEQPILGNPISQVVDVSISMPMRTRVDGYIMRHVETKLTQDQAVAMKAVLLGLMQREVRLQSGRIIKRHTDVIRWIAEQIAEAYANQHRDGN